MKSVVEVNTEYARRVEGQLAGIGVRSERLEGGTFHVRSALTARATEDQIIGILPNADIQLESEGQGCKGTVRFDGVSVMNE